MSHDTTPLPPPFTGGGEMGALLAATDWSDHPLGPPTSWPQSLRTAVSIVLRSQFPMFVFWGEQLIQLYNDAYIPITGAKHPEAQGAPGARTWAEIWDVLRPLVDSVVERGESTWNEDQLLLMERHGFPEETYFTFSYSPVADETGGVGGVFCACTETTGRVVADRRIRTVRLLADATAGSQSRREVVKRAVDVLRERPHDLPVVAIYTVDRDTGTCELAGTAGVRAGTEAAPEVVAHDTPEHDPRWAVVDAAINGTHHHVGDLGRVAHELSTEPWGEAPREAVVVPLADPTNGLAAGVLVAGLSPRQRWDEAYESYVRLLADTLGKAIVDATARERERERLEALAELSRAKSEFFSNVSHEFRTPLTLMLGPLEDALRSEEPIGGASLEQVHRNAQRLLKLVNTLLDFSRLESGRLSVSFRPVELAPFVEELAGVFRSAVERAGLELRVDVAPLTEPVHLDPTSFEKILLNLLSNAFKFTTSGHIAVVLRQQGGHAVVEVSDTGAGIATEDQEHLFERFFRAGDTTGRSFEGSGIGLALVQELVTLHGGEVEVESEPGAGSTFRVRIPLGTQHLDPDLITGAIGPAPTTQRDTYVAEAIGWLPDDRPSTPASSSDPTGDACVLVVDDNADMRAYLEHVLSPRWRVRSAANGQEALRAIEEDRPDLVLTDVMMPVLDGIGLTERLRSEDATRDLPVIMLSARAGEEAAGEGLEAGADDYITKPFTTDQLVARVRTNLEMARTRRDLAAARGRSELLAGVSHDMQTPLGLILGILSELRAGDQTEAERDDLLDLASRRASYLKLLVQQFVDHAHLEAGESVRIRDEVADVRSLALRALELVGDGDRVTVEGEALEVRADPERVVQIVTNLLQNATTYADGPVRVTVERDGAQVAVHVTDEGPGIAPEDRDLVFERFYRGHAGTDRSGSGLGLHISRRLAEAMGGTLTLDGTHATGARFTLRLPLAD